MALVKIRIQDDTLGAAVDIGLPKQVNRFGCLIGITGLDKRSHVRFPASPIRFGEGNPSNTLIKTKGKRNLKTVPRAD